jgi:hypothetical protein
VNGVVNSIGNFFAVNSSINYLFGSVKIKVAEAVLARLHHKIKKERQ